MPRKSTTAKTTAAEEIKKEAAAEVTAAAEKKTAAPKKAAAKTAAEPKKTTARKTAAKAAEPSTSVFFEYDGIQIVAKELLARAMEGFKAAHQDVEMKDVQLYVNGNEGFAYIVVNGVEYPEDKIAL